MIRALSLAAALAVLPLTAVAAEPDAADDLHAVQAPIEQAAAHFEARMEEFGRRAEALGADETLTEAQRELRIASLWSEYTPELQAFTTLVAEQASAIARQAIADVDIGAITAAAMSEVDLSGAMVAAGGIAANGAWASGDPEHAATYGLVAEYALGGALDAVDEAVAGLESASEPAEATANVPAAIAD